LSIKKAAELLDLFRQFGLQIPNLDSNNDWRQGMPYLDRMPKQEMPQDIGSGFILTSDGYILTNAHVVKNSDEIVVTLSDKREFKATVIGVDTPSDIAVLKIKENNLPVIKIGDSEKLKVGQWAIAIGSPFGLQSTVTAGIVSATSRDTGQYLPFIQTDVPINPGNSGGPLINMQSQVIGINSMIYSNSGGSMGISFSIPIDEAIRISDKLREHGYVIRGRLGVLIESISKDVASAIGLKNADGALVVRVDPDAPAEKAGVKAGDIILSVNGEKIKLSSEVPRIIGNVKPGSKVILEIYRNGQVISLKITIGEMDSDKKKIEQSKEKNDSNKKNIKLDKALVNYGLTVKNLDAAKKESLKIDAGIQVTSATEASLVAGLRNGDVILNANNIPVASVDAFNSIVNVWPKDKPLSILVKRSDGLTQFFVLRAMLP
jgi:serine protease Do